MTRFQIDFLESYSREEVVKELRRLAEQLGKQTLSRKDIDRHGRLSSGCVIKKFGSLRAAHEEANLTPARFMKATDQELFRIIIELWTITLEKLGRRPFRHELKTYGFQVSGDTVIRRFGSWNKALSAAAKATTEETGEALEEVPQADADERTPRRSLSVRKRFFVLKRDEYKCRLCGQSGVPLEVDHIVPANRGGSDQLDNLQTLCFACNRGKRDDLQ